LLYRVHEAFAENGDLVDDAYNKRIIKFFEEFEWYVEALETKGQKVFHIKNNDGPRIGVSIFFYHLRK